MFYWINNSSFWFAAGAILLQTFLAGALYQHPLWRMIITALLLLACCYAGARTGVLIVCCTTALSWLLCQKIRRSQLILLLVCLGITGLCVLFKQRSTAGGYFIVQQTLALIRQHPGGVGFGQFAVYYNLQQAAWFRNHSLNDATALLADDTEFALNEYLQLIAEAGIVPGMTCLLLNLVTLYIGFHLYRHSPTPLLLMALVTFTGILAGCSTFYLLHCRWLLWLYGISILSIYSMALLPVRMVTMGIALMAVILLFYSIRGIYRQQQYTAQLQDAVHMSRAGYKQAADSLFIQLNHQRQQADLWITWGEHLLQYGATDSALLLLSHARTLCSKASLYVLLGDAYVQVHQYNKAAYYYETAVYMVPNRFISRYKLAQYYRLVQQPEHERYWLRSILYLPEKVPSDVTQKIKAEAKLRLGQTE